MWFWEGALLPEDFPRASINHSCQKTQPAGMCSRDVEMEAERGRGTRPSSTSAREQKSSKQAVQGQHRPISRSHHSSWPTETSARTGRAELSLTAAPGSPEQRTELPSGRTAIAWVHARLQPSRAQLQPAKRLSNPAGVQPPSCHATHAPGHCGQALIPANGARVNGSRGQLEYCSGYHHTERRETSRKGRLELKIPRASQRRQTGRTGPFFCSGLRHSPPSPGTAGSCAACGAGAKAPHLESVVQPQHGARGYAPNPMQVARYQVGFVQPAAKHIVGFIPHPGKQGEVLWKGEETWGEATAPSKGSGEMVAEATGSGLQSAGAALGSTGTAR